MTEHRGTIRNLAKWFRLCVRIVDRSPRMECNTDISATVRAGGTSLAMLTRGQMARALREGAVVEARPGGTGRGAIATTISRVDVRKYIKNKDLCVGCGCVTLAMLMAATITMAPTAGIPRNSANPTSSAPKVAGFIPRTPRPSVGDGNSVHPYVSDVNQGHQKKMLNKITSVTAAAVVGIATTVGGAQSAAVQWRVEDGGNGHWYEGWRLSAESYISWNYARGQTLQRGGDLVSLSTPEEAAWVFENVAKDSSLWSVSTGPWVGGFQSAGAAEPSGGWSWLDGSVLYDGFPWGVFQPDNATYCGGPGGAPENHVCYWFGEGVPTPANTFADLVESGYCVARAENDWVTSAVVEWSADCNNDGIVDYGQCLNGTLPDYNGNNIPDCCDRGEACVVGNYPVQWRMEDGGNGHWYATSSSVGTWDAMRTLSIALGGDLASLQSMAENQAANRSRRAQDALTGGGPWIGGRKLSIQAWSWSDGSTWDFMNWAPGEPCCGDAGLYIHLYPGGEWNDHNQAQYPCRALIEWSADCNNDGTVDYGQILRGELPDINHNGAPDTCECIGDINVDDIINGGDLGVLLAYWGLTTNAPTSIACDLNADGVVNGSDLGSLLAYWGPCSN